MKQILFDQAVSSNLEPLHLWTDFEVETEKLSETLCQCGYRSIISTNEKARSKFLEFNVSTQKKALSSLLIYNTHLETARQRGINLKDTRKLLWSVLIDLNLRPCGDIMDKIRDDDLVEIYDSHFVQRFRNLLFFELCSYSVAEILIFDWPSLYRRPAEVTDELVEKFRQSFQESAKTKAFDSPPHLMWEVFSEEKRKFMIYDKYHSPIWMKGVSRPWGAIATKQVKWVQ